MIKVLTVIGTRPEAIKLAPVIRALRKRSREVEALVCATAQHREMLDQVLDTFSIKADFDLDLMRENQSLCELSAAVMTRLDGLLRSLRPHWVLVQGDTSTVMAASIAAFYNRVKIGHVEAGLRSHDKWQPFPEEINRQIAGVTADLHFAPTEQARTNLLQENVPSERIHVTGNTVIDALEWVASRPEPDTLRGILERIGPDSLHDRPGRQRIILVTAHRRENHGAGLEQICLALRDLAQHYGDDVHIVYPVHYNPNVWAPVHHQLDGIPNIHLVAPVSYPTLVHLMKRSYIVLTDSGGLQEEAPGLGKPVLVMRQTTERPEGIEAGTVKLTGTDRDAIVQNVRSLLDDPDAYRSMACAVNPYGDGKASGRIVRALLASEERKLGSPSLRASATA